MTQMVIGSFLNSNNANEAVKHLKDLGLNPKDVSVMAKDGILRQEVMENGGNKAVEGTVTGVTTGGLVGGLAGLLIGIGAVTIPGVGAVLIGGPLAVALGLTGAAATAVSGAVTGALAGGLVGSLVGLGVPEQEARVYEDKINTGSIVLLVPAPQNKTASIENELLDHGAEDIKIIDIPQETAKGKWRFLN